MSISHHITEPLAHDKKIFFFGFGYTANFLATKLSACGWKVSGTTTDPEKRDELRKNGIEAFLFERNLPLSDPYKILKDVTHVLFSIPPDNNGDPVFNEHALDLTEMKSLEWAGYLSTTGVYGNQDGKWIDETTTVSPSSRRGSLRLKAEEQWQSLCMSKGFPLHIFRLSGIYGPERSAIDTIRSGTARCIQKKDHVFNRVHIADVTQTLIGSINKPNPASIYNIADDTPSPSHEVIQFACNLIGIDPPPITPYDRTTLAPIVRSFYKDNKRIRNDKIKNELGVDLFYPDYLSGLQACLETEEEISALLEDNHILN